MDNAGGYAGDTIVNSNTFQPCIDRSESTLDFRMSQDFIRGRLLDFLICIQAALCFVSVFCQCPGTRERHHKYAQNEHNQQTIIHIHVLILLT